jgi:hypothetical protein
MDRCARPSAIDRRQNNVDGEDQQCAKSMQRPGYGFFSYRSR